MGFIRAVFCIVFISFYAACASSGAKEPAPPPSHKKFVFAERCDYRAKKSPCANKAVGSKCGQDAACLPTAELGSLSQNRSEATKFFSCTCDAGAPPPLAQSTCQITGQCSEYGDVFSIKFDTESCPMDYQCPVPSKNDPVWDNLACSPSEEGPMVRFRRPCVRGKLSKNNKREGRFLQGLKGPRRRSDQVPILW